MSDTPFSCEYCGRSGGAAERCEHCGREREPLSATDFRVPRWGRITIRLTAVPEATRVWSDLAKVWNKGVECVKPYPFPSQLAAFNTTAPVVALYGADFWTDLLSRELGGRGEIEFQELTHEELPNRPPYELPRAPTVPRNK